MAEFFDPTIALHVNSGAGAVAPPNPLGMATTLAGLQNTLLDARGKALALEARHTAGQIISSAPDMGTAIQRIQQNPLTAGFAQDILSNMASTQQTLTTTSGLQQGQNQTALGAITKAMNGALEDPQALGPLMSVELASMPPDIQARIAKPVAALAQSLSYPATPEGLQKYKQQLAGITTSIGGIDPSVVRSQEGTVAPSVGMAPVGPGGALVPVQTGGPMTGPGGAQVVGQEGPVTGPTIEQQSGASAKGGVAGTIAQDMAANAQGIPIALKRINMMQDALGNFQAGGGADARASVAKVMQALRNMGVTGITQQDIDKVGNSSLSSTQLFNSEVKPLVISQLKAAAQGTGRVMRSEVDAFLASMDSTTDPTTLMNLLNQARFDLQVGADQSQKYVTFKKLLGGKDPSVIGLEESDFPEWYLANYSPKNLPEALPTGTPIGPRPVGSALGAEGSSGSRPPLSSFFK